MSIHFSKERWSETEKNYSAWWKGELGRPLFKVTVKHAFEPERKKPPVPLLSQKTCHDFQYSAEELIDALDYELSQSEFLGDAFPFVNMAAFGPGSLAGFCGARMDNSTGSVWYFPEERKEIQDIHIQYDRENKWVRRIKDIYRAGQKKWGWMVLMSMPDLGGPQDVAAIFADSTELMCQLMDEPEEVHRLQTEVYQAFQEAYEDLNSVLKPLNPGYSDWGGLYSKDPSYILQDDFAYMISPQMFAEFGLPDIRKFSKYFTNTIYHLDGIGNLNHLDYLLKEEINAVQWVYGAGQPSARHWMEIYEKIYNAGKGIEVIGDLDDFLALYGKYPERLYYHVLVDDEEGNAMKTMDEKDCLNDYCVVSRDRKEEVVRLLDEVLSFKD
ncbi:hypothetical protein [Robinsoniella peoriensis]|uniref:hypothetical protein n=1 Tax=Robinsoniella peoriensis TaxID=180332 RepID=UPI00375308FC